MDMGGSGFYDAVLGGCEEMGVLAHEAFVVGGAAAAPAT